MKKVILFSPNGYVGSHIKKRLQEAHDIQLYEMVRESEWAQYKENYDIMIYSAAITSARNESADKYVQDNVVMAVKVIAFCKKHDVKRIIYLSTDEIYGELNTDIVTEKGVMLNPNLYATTKYMAEKIIEQSGIPYYILRMPGVVGKIWGKNFIYNLMEKIERGDHIDLYNIDREYNNILDIDDLTRFIVILCNREKKEDNEIILLGNTEYTTLREVVYYIKKLYNSNSVIDNINTNQKRCFRLDVTKAVEYGYCSKSLKTILEELYLIQKG